MKTLAHALAVATVLLLPAQAHADAVRVGDGSAFVVTDWRDYWDGTFSNSGTFVLPPDIITGVFGREIFANARSGCQPCVAGDPINLSGSFELRGPRYLSAGDEYAVYGTGVLNFHGGSTLVPVSDALSTFVTAPFEFDGFISLYRVPGDVLFFQSAVYGSGTTRAFLWMNGGGSGRVFHQQIYGFGPHPFTPVPEPATFVLCATGVGVLVRRARNRRRANA